MEYNEGLLQRARDTDDAGRLDIAREIALEATQLRKQMLEKSVDFYTQVRDVTQDNRAYKTVAGLTQQLQSTQTQVQMLQGIDTSALETKDKFPQLVESTIIWHKAAELNFRQSIPNIAYSLEEANRLDIMSSVNPILDLYTQERLLWMRAYDIARNDLDTSTHRSRKQALKRQYQEALSLVGDRSTAFTEFADIIQKHADEDKQVIGTQLKQEVENEKVLIEQRKQSFEASIDAILTPNEMLSAETGAKEWMQWVVEDTKNVIKGVHDFLILEDEHPAYQRLARCNAELLKIQKRAEAFDFSDLGQGASPVR